MLEALAQDVGVLHRCEHHRGIVGRMHFTGGALSQVVYRCGCSVFPGNGLKFSREFARD